MTTRDKILIVDDEPQILRFLRTSLAVNDYDVIEASSGSDALQRAAAEAPDAVLLDLGLPDMDGKEVIRALREGSQVPIIVLTVRAREAEKIEAFDLGADDYVTKPFGMGELLARLRAALRHRAQGAGAAPVFRSGPLQVDILKRLVALNSEPVHLTPKEYDLLKLLVTHAGKVVTHRQLLQGVWGPAHVEDATYLRVFIGQLRRKIEIDPNSPKLILTEPGVGYRLLVDE